MPTLSWRNSSVPLIRNPIGSLGGHSASRLSRVLADVRQPWLDEQQGALAHLEYSTNRCPCKRRSSPGRDRQGTPWRDG